MKGKNSMKRIVILLMILTLCLTLAACGGDDNAASPTTAPTAAEAGSMTVEEFLTTSAGMTAAKNFKNSAEAEGNCTARCYAEGNIMVFEGSFISEIPADKLSSIKAAIDSYLNSDDTAAGMETILEGLVQYGVADPKAKIVFCDVNGNVLGEKIYE